MHNRTIALALVGALFLQGCATPNSGGAGVAGNDVEKKCSEVVLGVAAFLTCGLIAKGNNRVATGAACAAVAVLGCYLVNSYKSEQTRTAEQVEDDYLRRSKQLPERATLTGYSTSVNPRGAIQRNQTVEVKSNIVVVPGKADKKVKVEEELAIIDATGDQWGTPKRMVANDSGQGGEFTTSSKLKIHDSMQQGVYTLQKKVFINGIHARDDNTAKFQVVQGLSGLTVAMVSE